MPQQPARGLRDHQAADDEQDAGRKRDPKNSAPHFILKIEKQFGVSQLRNLRNLKAVIERDDGGGPNSGRQQPLEDARAFAPVRRRQALGQIERNDDSNESPAHALQKSAKDQRPVAL